MTLVPNRFPSILDPSGRRLAVVGEAPGRDEEDAIDAHGNPDLQPFVGASGRLLRMLLSQRGITPESCFFGNICQTRPPNNDISTFEWTGPEITDGIAALEADLRRFNPHCILSLGRTPFRYFNPSKCYPTRATEENPDGIAIPISNWRGSPFIGTGGYKIIPTFHPAYILRAYSDIAYLRADITRAVRHSRDRTLTLPTRIGNLRPTLDQVVQFLSNLRRDRTPASYDIEGYSDAIGVTMLGIAPTSTTGLVIPFWIDGKNYWTEEEEPVVWQFLSAWLADPLCPKTAHNCFYENLVLMWRHQCLIANTDHDTMMMQWEMFNELEKSLAVSISLWIEEPYYKDDRESSGDTKLGYNFKDCACTQGVKEAILPVLVQLPRQHDHYRFNISLVPAFSYMHLRGCRFDSARASDHLKKTEEELAVVGGQINNTIIETPDGPKSIETHLGHPFNAKSTTDKKWFLYDHLGVEPSKRWGESTKEELLHRYYKKTKNQTLQQIIQAVSLRTRVSDIEKLKPNADGRIRTAYDLVAAVTGRLNSRTSSIVEQIGHTKKGRVIRAEFGTNLQNVTQPLRDIFIPDSPDFLFWQADLQGADAWTVAADLAACGEDRMLRDLQVGVKPAKLLLAMLNAIEAGEDPSVIARLDAQAAKAVCDAIHVPEGVLPDGRPANWLYTCMKRVQHGTNYLGQSETISAVIFKDSDGRIDIYPSEIERYQRLYLLRYNVGLRRDYLRTCLLRDGFLQTAPGPCRKFFGIRNPRVIDDDILREAMASEPQTVTTYCTNQALRNLWYDPINRRKSGALFIEPLLQIHDALAGQFPARLRDFARERINSYFNNPITIHGITLTIPADICCGPSWGKCKEKL